MKRLLAFASFAGLFGAGSAVFWSVLDQPRDAYLSAVASDFNLSSAPEAPRRAPSPQAAPAGLRDAVSSRPPPRRAAARAATRVVGVASETPIPAFLVREAAKPALAPAHVQGHSAVRSLVSSPAQFMVSRTFLGKPEELGRFMNDKRRVERYVGHPLIKGVLDRPALTKWLLGHPAVVRAFLASPAMRDQRTVSQLSESELMARILESEGAQAIVSDPKFLQQVFSDPQTSQWIARNPSALAALTGRSTR